MSVAREIRLVAAWLIVVAAAQTGGAADRDKVERKDQDISLAARCHDVAVAGDLVVLGQTGGIVTLDVSDPANPRELGRLGIKATVLDVTLDGDTAWLAAGAYGVVQVDLSSPESPRFEQRIDDAVLVEQQYARHGEEAGFQEVGLVGVGVLVHGELLILQ